MTPFREPIEYRRFAAPRENRAALVDPPLGQVGGLIDENIARRAQLGRYDVQGRRLAELSEQARVELLAAARRWTGAYRRVDLASEDPRGPILLAGHQPELFHPGVWFKNFALGTLARRHRAAAVNLVIDGDTIKSTSLRVPGGSLSDPQVEPIPLDRAEGKIPYEERPILDRGVWAAFGPRVESHIAPWIADPLIRRLWPMVLARSKETDRLGHCLVQARHQLEGQWGLETLEIPQSWVCESEAFRWFVAHLLAQLPRFREVHNQAVHEYRRAHRIRNAAHPIPDLAADGPWIEAPLWIWTADRPERQRAFARRDGGEIVLSDRLATEIRLPLEPEGDAAGAVEALRRASGRGIRLRSRALVTTLWARLALGDLFLHGIGGAKYDQVTDRLMERFFACRPPGVLVLSATLHLPVEGPERIQRPDGAIRQELRDLAFHPEKHVGGSPGVDGGSRAAAPPAMPRELAELIAAKRGWIQTPENAYARWQALRRINAAMQPWVAEDRRRLLEQQARAAQSLRAERILRWREYGFCLYPEKILQEFFEALLPRSG